VKYERVCTADGKKLEWDEIVKGYEYEKGQFAVVEKEELEEAQEETSTEVPVLEFVARGDIDPMSFDKPYFLAPDRGGERAYSVLREALAQEDKVAIVRITLRKRPHLAAVHPEREALALTMIRTTDDLRSVDTLDLSTRTPSGDEVKMARALVAQMTTSWTPDQYHDEYRERLESLIQEKVPRRRKVEVAKPEKAGAPSQLMDVLARSLEAHKKTPRKAARAASHEEHGEAGERRRVAAKRKPSAKRRTPKKSSR
jgi:DNA end-binding protein Ku